MFADLAIPIAPSAAAKLSCPAKNAKHFVSSESNIDAKFPCPNPTFLSSATEPGIQNACNPSPIAFAASAALVHPFLIAIAAPNVYAQAAFSKHIGCTPFTISYGLNPLSVHIFNASSKSFIPYFSITGLIWSILLS